MTTLFKHELSSDALIELAERGQQYAKNPNCSRCKEKINTVEEALLIGRADGSFALTHFSQDCYSEEIAAMTLRHIANGRLRWTVRADANTLTTEAQGSLRVPSNG